jgi:hypothetical protein
LYEAGHKRQQHRRVVDQVAATLILQSFLDERQVKKTSHEAAPEGADDGKRLI